MLAPEDTFYTNGTALFDVPTGRFHVEYESVSPWRNGAAPSIGIRSASAFDGTLFSEWRRSRHGTELPDLEVKEDPKLDGPTGPLHGDISGSAKGPNSTYAVLSATGLTSFPPFVFAVNFSEPRLKRVSVFLDDLAAESKSPPIVQNEKGLWVLTAQLPLPPKKPPLAYGSVRCVFDPRKGAALTELSWHLNPSDTPWCWSDIELKEHDSGLWLPREISVVQGLSGFGSRITVDAIEVDPPVEPSEFVVDMPMGTQVTDDVEGLRYVVSAGPIDEAAAVRKFAQLNGLRPIEVRNEDLLGGAQSFWRQYGLLVGINALFLVAAVVYSVWVRCVRHRRTSGGTSTNGLILAPFLLASVMSTAVGGESSSGALSWRSAWRVEHTEKLSLCISQCGFNVATLALHLFEREFDPLLVARELRPTLNGIRMSDLRQVLISHGLRVEARQDVSLDDLIDSVQPGLMVIAAVVLPDDQKTLHYVAFVHDSKRSVLLLDPPGRCERVKAGERLFQNKEQKFVALFVVHGKQQALTATVRGQPATKSSGSAKEDAPAVARTVVLSNSSPDPLMVVGIRTGCGCVTVGWQGGVIPGG